MKKKCCYIIYCLSSILLTVSCHTSTKQEVAQEQPLYIYSLETPAGLSEENARKLIAQYLGDTAPQDMIQSRDKVVYYVSKKDLNTTFEQDLKTGNFTFNRDMTRYMGDFAPTLPDTSRAVAMSEAFLKTNGIYPKSSAELKIVHKGGLRSQALVDGKKGGAIIDKLVTLTYGRVLDSLPVIGAGSKIVVNLGDKGEVVGVVHRWREVNKEQRKAVAPEEIISQEEATERAKRQIATEYGAKTAYTINTVSKAYYDNNGSILQPVYSFETTITLNDKNTRPFNYLCVIPMLKDSPEPLELTAVDPKAKALIKTGRPDIQDTTKGRDRKAVD